MTAFDKSVAMLDTVRFLLHDQQMKIYFSTVLGFGLGCHLKKQLSPTLITRNGSEGGSPS